jgi:uncharacterized membrane protein YqiK
MSERETPKRLFPAIIAIAIVVALLWLFLGVLRP